MPIKAIRGLIMKGYVVCLLIALAANASAFLDQHIIGSELIVPAADGAKTLVLDESWIRSNQEANAGFGDECAAATEFIQSRITSSQPDVFSTKVFSDTYLVQDEYNGQPREYRKRVSKCLLISSIGNLPFRVDSFGRMSAARAEKLAAQLYQDKNVIAVVRTKVSSWNHVRMQLDVIYNR